MFAESGKPAVHPSMRVKTQSKTVSMARVKNIQCGMSMPAMVWEDWLELRAREDMRKVRIKLTGHQKRAKEDSDRH